MIAVKIPSKDVIGFLKTFLAIVIIGFILSITASDYLLPFILIVSIFASAFLLAQFSMANFFLLMVLFIPISSNQTIFETEVTLLVPSEPIEAIIALAFGIKILFGYQISGKILKHPIFLLLLSCFILQFASVANSTMISVSLKSILLKSCYVNVFFLLAADLYLKNKISHFTVLKTYLFSIFIIGIFIFCKHSDYGFSKDISGTVTEPFYADHTIYSACLAMIIPYPLLLFFNAKKMQINFYKKFWIGCLSLILIVFFFLTYCRAGWISFIISLILTLAVYNGLKFKSFAFLILISIGLIVLFNNEITENLKQNKADSNAKNATLEQQTKSVTNISNDQSNAERLNRWSCAWRMFLDKPYLGYGPGTYQFEYLSYQKKSEMTRISITSPFNVKKGKGGTAHSEYLLLLSECGIFCFIFYIMSIFTVIYYAMKIYNHSKDAATKVKIMVLIFGFSTYLLHAFFNNFLDTDKAALLYYTSIAAIMIESINLKSSLSKKTI